MSSGPRRPSHPASLVPTRIPIRRYYRAGIRPSLRLHSVDFLDRLAVAGGTVPSVLMRSVIGPSRAAVSAAAAVPPDRQEKGQPSRAKNHRIRNRGKGAEHRAKTDNQKQSKRGRAQSTSQRQGISNRAKRAEHRAHTKTENQKQSKRGRAQS
jgi:hypothetical protein